MTDGALGAFCGGWVQLFTASGDSGGERTAVRDVVDVLAARQQARPLRLPASFHDVVLAAGPELAVDRDDAVTSALAADTAAYASVWRRQHPSAARSFLHGAFVLPGSRGAVAIDVRWELHLDRLGPVTYLGVAAARHRPERWWLLSWKDAGVEDGELGRALTRHAVAELGRGLDSRSY